MNKSIIGALVVLVVLVVAFFLVDRTPYVTHEGEVSAGFQRLQEAKIDDAARIEIAKGEGKVELKKEGGQWLVASSFNYPADDEKVGKILKSLGELEDPEQFGNQRGSHANFEVDEKKGGKLRVFDGGGQQLANMTIGKTATGGSITNTRVFVRFDDEDATYRVATNLRSDASLWGDDAEGKNYIEKDVFKLPSDMEIQSVRVVRPEQQDLLVERRFRDVPVDAPEDDSSADKDGEGEKSEPETKREEYFVVTSGTETHEVESGQSYVARGILNAGQTISVEDVVEPKEPAAYGLDQPQLRAAMQYRRKDEPEGALLSFEVAFGDTIKNDKGEDDGHYFRISDAANADRVYRMLKYKFGSWDKKLEDFLPKEEEPEEPAEDGEEPQEGTEIDPAGESDGSAAPTDEGASSGDAAPTTSDPAAQPAEGGS